MRSLARFCSRHRLLTVLLWIVLLVGLTVGAQLRPGPTTDDYTIAGSPSAQAQAMLEEHDLEDGDATSAQVVVHDPDGLERHETTLTTYVDELTADHPDWEIRPGDGTALSEVSDDGTTGYLDITVSDGPLEAAGSESVATALADTAPQAEGLQVEHAGDIFPGPSGGPGEGIGLLVAAGVLLLAFGSLIAMALPIVVAVFGAGTGVMALGLTGHLIELPAAAAALSAMLAVGVGIDYSLLLVTRYRELLASGAQPREAVEEAMATSGRSVLVAGVTVVVAVLGLLLMNMPLINGIALGAALAVSLTMLAALTLMPALLALAGTRIDRWGLPGPMRAHPEEEGVFARWARFVQRHRWAGALVSLAALVALSVPALDLRLGFDDAGLPASTTQGRAHQLVTDAFGPGTHSPLIVAVDTSGVSGADEEAALGDVRDALTAAPGVQDVSGPFASDDGEAAAAIVVPTSGAGDEATDDLVRHLRTDVLPELGTAGIDAEVTGTTAAAIDFSQLVQDRLPWFVAVVLVISFLLLAWSYRSLLVPLKAVVMNVLSIGAAFGVAVAVVQWGWGADLLGLETGPVTAWVPMMLVAVVFGLSMDYEVFFLSRIKEYVDAGVRDDDAVAMGLARTGRIISAAAAVMVAVFAGFMLGSDAELKVFGLGLAAAVLIDATVVRMLLVPATMTLMGKANWWAPGWMRRRQDKTHGRAAPAVEVRSDDKVAPMEMASWTS